MKQDAKHAPQARESSFNNLLSGWVQQGVENFFATQRILVDLAMRQNGTVVDVMSEKLTAPDFRPVAVVKESAGEGLANFIEGQKLIVELAQRESEILATAVKERVGGFPVTDALVDTVRRSVDTFVEMQLDYLKCASKQVHGRLAAVKAGEETSVHLLAGALQVIQLHLYESVDAATNCVDESIGNRESTNPLFDGGRQNLALPLCQFDDQLLAFDEVGQSLTCRLFDHCDRTKIRCGQLLTHNIDDSSILAHRQVHKDPLRSKEVLNSLLHPSR